MARLRWYEMAGPVQTLAQGVQDPTGIPAVTKISTNIRVKAMTGFIGTAADTLIFPAPLLTVNVAGQWLLPNQRCLVNGVPTISVSSTGIALTLNPAAPPPLIPTGPMVVTVPDPRVIAM